MPTRPPKQSHLSDTLVMEYRDFSGGLDRWTKRPDMPNNTGWFLENCFDRKRIHDENSYGALCSRPGLNIILENPLGVGPGSLTNLNYVSTTIAVVSNWILALTPSTGDIWATQWPAPLGWVLLGTVPGATQLKATSASGYGILAVYGPGVGGIFSFDGAALSAITTAIQPKFIAYYKNRVFVAGEDAVPYRFRYSDLRNPLAGYDLNFVDDIDDDTGWQITGMIEFQTSLYFFTGIRVWSLAGSGPPDYRLYKVNTSVGCSAPNSLVTDGDSLYFLSNRGVIKWDANGEPQYLSQKVWPYIRSDWNPGFAANATGVYHNWAYYFGYQTAAGVINNRVLICDLLSGGWFPTKEDSWNFASTIAVENGLYILAGDAVNGRLWQIDETFVDGPGVDIEVEWRHKHEDFGYPTTQKLLDHIEIELEVTGDTSLVTLEIYRDFSVTPELLITDPTVDISTASTGLGAHDAPGAPTYTRTVAIFREPGTAGSREFTNLSWAIRRSAGRSPLTIHAVRVYAHLMATVP